MLPCRFPLPDALLDSLRQRVSTQQQTLAESVAQRLITQIEESLHGYLQTPAWALLAQTEDVLPIIEQALAQPCDLQLTYWTGGRNEKLVRRVTPYHLETRQGVLYLSAWCHLRQAERVFRVDRVEEAVVVQK